MVFDRPVLSRRQKLASITPRFLRKFVRMVEHYTLRMRMWRDVRRYMTPVDDASRRIVKRSLLASPFTAFRKLDSYQPPALLDDVLFDVASAGRFRARAGTDDILHVMISREPALYAELKRRLQPGDVFVDAGANIGFYTIIAAHLVGDAGKVVAFEMMPDTAAILREHVSMNAASNVTIIEKALSKAAGESVTAHVTPGQYGQASINPEQTRAGMVSISVETVTFDLALELFPHIRVLKIDLEGAEYLALCGGNEVLKRTDCVLFESNIEDQRIFDLLKGHGFTIKRLHAHDFMAEREARA